MRVVAVAALLVAGTLAWGQTAGPGAGAAEIGPLPYQLVMPGVARGELPPPRQDPPVYDGPVAGISLASARLSGWEPVEVRDTHYVGGREFLEDPTGPANIAWYPRFGRPGHRGGNTVFAAHINYVGYGNGPFAYLTSVVVGDALYVTMADNSVYTYTVDSVTVIPLADLNMDAVVFPGLDEHTERITLISCGGTFVPNPGGGGVYDSRVVLVAERYIP